MLTLTSKKSWTFIIAVAVAMLPILSVMASPASAGYDPPSDSGTPYGGGNDTQGY